MVPGLLDFLNESWTPFHATAECARQLSAAGFCQLAEHEPWSDVRPGGRYFFTRNMSSIVAFAVGAKYQEGNGFNVIAAHTDSPCLKLKPVSAAVRSGFLSVGVQIYGGGLWYTWFDRDLSVAGRVLLRLPGGGPLQHRLVRVRRPVLRIPTLAIHLDRTVITDGFKPNLETHLAPILATQVKSELNQPAGDHKNGAAAAPPPSAHHPLLLQIVAEELGCKEEDIVDFELNVCDTQPSCTGGGRDEFVLSGRLDNLASSFCALRALVESCGSEADLADERCVRMLALFDNEEVGSNSAQGAGSPVLFQAIKRLVGVLTSGSVAEGVLERSLRRSFLVSADMAHALHPNFPERHEEHHAPKLQEGLVVKHNANQRYATDVVSAYLFKEVARLQGIPTQSFVVRNDMGCGSTIGPILASGVGLRTVDVGMPQLSMHSIREMCGVQDIDIGYRHFKAFYSHFSSIDQEIGLDR